ncbi:MAG: hypothetical protein HYT42_00235 [Candidatus Sungbacteria bacterium]|nr:hypothetical protein [Candidatus Sungbacteria bacterium]
MPVERFGIFDVYYDRATHAARIVTGQGGLLETADQGRTWRVVRWFSEGLVKLLVNPIDTSIQLVVTPAGSVFRTEDRGLSWADLTPVLRDFPAATVDQKWLFGASGKLYLGSGYGLLRSPDSGTTFSPLELIIPPEALPILAIAADPQNSANLVVSAGSQIYRSKDDGATWSILTTPTAKNIIQLLFDPRNSETIYAVANP